MSAYHIFTTATGPQKPHFCNQGVQWAEPTMLAWVCPQASL